jgi:hypothetical protein
MIHFFFFPFPFFPFFPPFSIGQNISLEPYLGKAFCLNLKLINTFE